MHLLQSKYNNQQEAQLINVEKVERIEYTEVVELLNRDKERSRQIHVEINLFYR